MCHDDCGFVDQGGCDGFQALFRGRQVSPNDTTGGGFKAGNEMEIRGDESIWRVRSSCGNGTYNTTYGLVTPWESKSSGEEEEEEERKERHFTSKELWEGKAKAYRGEQ